MDLETTLEALEHTGYPFPEQAVRWAVEHPAEIMAPLLESLRETPAQTMEREDGFFLNVFAMYLLAQLREAAAFEPIIEYHATITEAEDDLTEGVVTEGLCHILASLYPGDDAAIRRLIEDPAKNEWVRGAAVRVYPSLLASGQITRGEVVDYYRYLLDKGLERQWSHVWDSLSGACGDIHPEGLMPSLESAFEANLIDPYFYSLERLRKDLELTPEQTLANAFTHRTPLIEDTVRELSYWACFQPPKPKPAPMPVSPAPARVHAYPNHVTVTKGLKVGRNALCPCGSGKKYKKCCLSKGVEYRET